MKIYNENFLVVGLSKSGISASKLLLSKGAKVFLYDQAERARIDSALKELTTLGAVEVQEEGVETAIKNAHVVVLSPGVPIDHPIALKASQLKKRVIGELELGSLFIKAPIVAVTGTNGKTTTVSMIEWTLKNAGVHALALGNVGVPLTSAADSFPEKGVAVVEVSSFQLETVRSFTPHIGVLMNLTQDHLNRHYSMKIYGQLKARTFQNMRESEYAVLSDACALSHEIARKTKAQVIWFSTEKEVPGAYVQGSDIYYMGEPLFSVHDLALKQKHNVENALATVAVCKLLGIDNEVLRQSLAKFRGAKHRLEVVCTQKGINYINDSKATNPDATLSAVKCMKKPTVLLLGGQEKGYDYRSLFRDLLQSAVRYCIFYGENREKLIKDALNEGFTTYSVVENLWQAVRVGQTVAKAGETVLLSPASASFDEFNGYEQRGNTFKNYVTGRKGNGNENNATRKGDQ
ncbi:MAG: UDP-N-acetylmuramoyl-L-alanine--D-glutamate ligase [Clostridia bacterium]|nr:UDP-N-acetylmuramoyl-L-alanine--D-glutamate ligase [Clostridia bacterium]